MLLISQSEVRAGIHVLILLTDRLEKIKLDRGDEHLLHGEFRRHMLSHF